MYPIRILRIIILKNINIEHLILSFNNKITENELNKNTKKLDLFCNYNIRDEDLKKLDFTYLNLVEIR
jgi:hypothetical protein